MKKLFLLFLFIFRFLSIRVKFAACVFYPLRIWLIVAADDARYWMIKKGLPDRVWNALTAGATKARKDKDALPTTE